MVSWFRSTLGCAPNTFRGYFGPPTPVTVVADIVTGSLGAEASNAEYNGKYKTPDFMAYGGNNSILPHCKWEWNPNAHPPLNPPNPAPGDYVLTPEFQIMTIFVPKGVYGIGELAQLIEDQFNGVIFYDKVNNKLITKSDTFVRRDGDFYAVANDTINIHDEIWDGQPYNRPFLKEIDVLPRYYQTDIDRPEKKLGAGVDSFLNMKDYTDMVDYVINTNEDIGTYPNQSFAWHWMRGNPDEDDNRNAPNSGLKIRPFYMIRQNYDTTATGEGGNTSNDISYGHEDDSLLTRADYNLYNYASGELNRKKLIGTTNFSFKYDSEKNGFSINGLHNCMRSPSHDRFGSKISSAGQTVINFKKIRTGGVVYNYANGVGDTPAEKETRNKLIGALNNPETRDGGVMIVNWAFGTSQKKSTTNKIIHTQELAKFQDFFTSEEEAIEIWKTTLWYRLGFDYNQLNQPNGTNFLYNDGTYPDYGFTTDAPIDNSIVSTISTLNNPMSYKPTGASEDVAGFQFFNTMNTAIPNRRCDEHDMQGLYSNSMYTECATYPVIIGDVGGIVAKRLPTLTIHPYFLITTDLCDNYKDNVKNGDVLPLIGIVPKTSLSNQDFITSENQIIQVLSQSKVVNSFSIKILNPDLTAPELETNSSIIFKINLA